MRKCGCSVDRSELMGKELLDKEDYRVMWVDAIYELRERNVRIRELQCELAQVRKEMKEIIERVAEIEIKEG